MHADGMRIAGQLIDIFAAAILVTAFLIVSSRSIVFYIRLFAIQSFPARWRGASGGVRVRGTEILIAGLLTIGSRPSPFLSFSAGSSKPSTCRRRSTSA